VCGVAVGSCSPPCGGAASSHAPASGERGEGEPTATPPASRRRRYFTVATSPADRGELPRSCVHALAHAAARRADRDVPSEVLRAGRGRAGHRRSRARRYVHDSKCGNLRARHPWIRSWNKYQVDLGSCWRGIFVFYQIYKNISLFVGMITPIRCQY